MGHHADVLEPQVAQERNEFCLRQSSCDSTGPQVDIAPDVVAELLIQHDIAKL